MHNTDHTAAHNNELNETRSAYGVGVLFLVAILLVSAILVPTRTDAEPVDIETAAIQAAAEFVAKVVAEAGFVEGWQHARLGTGSVLFDPNGEALFYEFPVILEERIQGRFKVAADSVLGVSVLTMEGEGRELTPEEIIPFAIDALREQRGEIEVVGAWPVIIRGLQLGIAVAGIDQDSGREVVVTVDADSLTEVPGRDLRSTLAAIGEDEIEERLQRWEADNAFATELVERLAEYEVDLAQIFEAPFDPTQWNMAAAAVAQLNTASWHTVDLTRCKLYKQIAKDGCARAVLQMLNHFHLGGPKHSQSQISTILNAWGWGNNSVDWYMPFLKYLKKYTVLPGSYYVNIDPKVGPGSTWMEMALQIDGNQPFAPYEVFVTWNTAHIMFAVGYIEEDKEVFGGHVFEEKWLGLYDPAGGTLCIKLWNGSMMSYQLEGYVVAEK